MIWARFYIPKSQVRSRGDHVHKLPLMLYFHGGGFCVGSASWICYHSFLAKLAVKANCMIISVNYRLAPENPLPAAYEDGIKTLMWVQQQRLSRVSSNEQIWVRRCNFKKIFLAGDSAGANIAHHVSKNMLSSDMLRPLSLKGTILIQPFFGGEARTNSEKYLTESSALTTLEASDAYWRMALPQGANRDHPWCNPHCTMSGDSIQVEACMVCIAELDIMKDRNLDFCAALARGGTTKVEVVVHKGVGHAFQILNKSQHAQIRTLELINQVSNFIAERGVSY